MFSNNYAFSFDINIEQHPYGFKKHIFRYIWLYTNKTCWFWSKFLTILSIAAWLLLIFILFKKFNVGAKSLYTLGFVETSFEIILILYFTIASLVGLYSLPFLKSIKPNVHSTPIRQIILNCAIYLVFSSALPVSSKILGLYFLIRTFLLKNLNHAFL